MHWAVPRVVEQGKPGGVGHGTALPHWPLALHVSTALEPEHCVAPGVHTPVHAPATHAWLTHATGLPH